MVALAPHVRSLRDRLWSLVQRRVVLEARQEDTSALDERLEETVRSLRRQGMTPIEIRAEVAEAEENAARLRGALYENPPATEERETLERAAGFIFKVGKQLFARGTVKDAVAWEDPYGMRVAWIMDPKRMRNAGVDHEGRVPFTGRQAARVFEYEGVRAETLKYEREMVMSDFLERASNELYALSGGEEPIRITIIPVPGYPWPAPSGYYSAKKQRWLDSPRPDWLLPENVVDEMRHINSPGIDLCGMFREPLDYVRGEEIVRYGRGDDDVFLVTHTMGTIEGVTRFGSIEGVAGWEQNAQKVMECGGLIFPSLAIGPVPATNFGVGVLVADAGIVLNSLSPYRRRGAAPPAAIYNSDAWSGRTGDFFVDTAVAAFEQLHGHSDYMYYTDLNVWPLGAPRAWVVTGPGAETEEIYKIATLKRELKERFRLWRRDLSPEQIEELMERVALTKARYGYLEAKANGIMKVGEFPFAAVPPQQEEGFRRFLDITGFEGEVLVVDLPDELLEVMRPGWDPPNMSIEKRSAIKTWASLQYGWHVSDAVREAAGREVSL